MEPILIKAVILLVLFILSGWLADNDIEGWGWLMVATFTACVMFFG